MYENFGIIAAISCGVSPTQYITPLQENFQSNGKSFGQPFIDVQYNRKRVVHKENKQCHGETFGSI